MTVIDKFVSFAQQLPADQLESLEEALEELMLEYGGEDFTPAELAEIDRRAAEKNPRYADPEAIEAILGKSYT